MQINENTIVLGLEGGMAAGKTSCAKSLSKQGFATAGEYMEYIHRDLHPYFGTWPPDMRLRFLSDVDSARATRIDESECVALDRTYLTYLSHDFAAAKMGATPPITRYLTDQILNGATPTHLVFLTVDHVERQRRLQARNGLTESYLASGRFNNALLDFFRAVSQEFPILFIDTSSTPTKTVASKCQDWIANDANMLLDHEDIVRKAIELIKNA